MITLDPVKVAAIHARRNARAPEPAPLPISTHTIERTIIERLPGEPAAPLVGSWRDAMRAVEEREAGDALAPELPPLPPAPAAVLTPDEVLSAATRKAIAGAADNQRRYELAVQARNGKAEAMELIQLEASERGETIASMVQIIIDERAASERRTMTIIAADVRWRKAIADAGLDGGAVAEAAAAEIATL